MLFYADASSRGAENSYLCGVIRGEDGCDGEKEEVSQWVRVVKKEKARKDETAPLESPTLCNLYNMHRVELKALLSSASGVIVKISNRSNTSRSFSTTTAGVLSSSYDCVHTSISTALQELNSSDFH